MQTNGAALLHIRDGKVTRLVIYPYADRAFSDLGLTLEKGGQHLA
jgi:ketosteroid isomerase-like protein